MKRAAEPQGHRTHEGEGTSPSLSRRSFLKKLAALAAPVAVTKIIDGAALAGIALGDASNTQSVYSAGERSVQVANRLQPVLNLVIVHFRNLVMAQKYHFLRKQGYKHLLFTLGAAHHGIEEAVMASEAERLGEIRAILSLPLFKSAIGDARTLYSLSSYGVSKITSGVYHHPEQDLQEPKLHALYEQFFGTP